MNRVGGVSGGECLVANWVCEGGIEEPLGARRNGAGAGSPAKGITTAEGIEFQGNWF